MPAGLAGPHNDQFIPAVTCPCKLARLRNIKCWILRCRSALVIEKAMFVIVVWGLCPVKKGLLKADGQFNVLPLASFIVFAERFIWKKPPLRLVMLFRWDRY